MGAFLRWFLGVLAVLVVGAIFEPSLMAYFASIGWSQDPWQLLGAPLNLLVGLVGEAVVPWVAGGVLGSAAGAWGHFLAQRFDRKRPNKRRRRAAAFSSLAWEIEDAADALANQASYWSSLPYYSDQRGRWGPDVYGRYLSLEIKLGKLGVVIPHSNFLIGSRGSVERVGAVVALLRVLHRMSLGSLLTEAQTHSLAHSDSIQAEFSNSEATKALEQERGSEFPPR